MPKLPKQHQNWSFYVPRGGRGPNPTTRFAAENTGWMPTSQMNRLIRQRRQLHQSNAAASAAEQAAAGVTQGAIAPPTTVTIPLPGASQSRDQALGLNPASPKSAVFPMPGQASQPRPSSYSTTPSWWINQAYSNANPEQTFANVANMLLPYLSPEDQRSMASYLATNFKDVFGAYANANFGPIPTTMGEAERKAFLSPQRAQQALGLLDAMKAATGNKDMGTGYEFLRNAVNLIGQYGNGPMTREQYDQFTNAVAALTAQASSDQKAYANLAQMFNLPSFTAGPLVSNEPNKKLYS